MARVSESPPRRDGGASTRHAYERLRASILDGELAPGEVFSQVRLAAELGVSRTPLREAVRLLQTEGLLLSEPNRRVRVAPVTTGGFEELYAERIALESLAVALSVPLLDGEELDRVGVELRESIAASQAGDLTRYRVAHRDFHLGLCAHAGERLHGRVSDLWDHAERFRLLYVQRGRDRAALSELASRDHTAIHAAAVEQQAARCARLVAEHLARTALTTIALLDERHDPAAVRIALAQVADPA